MPCLDARPDRAGSDIIAAGGSGESRMIKQLFGALATALLVGAGVVGVAAVSPAAAEAQQPATIDVARPFADPSPSPTLGATPQPDRAPGDDNDGNWNDFSQVGLAVVAPLGLAAVVGGSVVFYLIRRARRRSTVDEARSRGDGNGHR